MTKIVTRPQPTSGTGPYTVNMTFEEVQLIGALMYVTRLGFGLYAEAAARLLNSLDNMFDQDFAAESAQDVQMTVSIVDDQDKIVQSVQSDFIILEV